jgi:Trk-type K+ transport system membrane component
LVHPRAVTPLVLGDRVLPERIRVGVLGFFFVYVATVAVGTLLIAFKATEPAPHAGGVLRASVEPGGRTYLCTMCGI